MEDHLRAGFWGRIRAAGAYESDPGFRAVIRRLCGRGMRVAGVLGILVVVLFVGGHLLSGKSPAFRYGRPDTVVLWDKLAIILLSTTGIVLSWTDLGRRWGRLLAALLLVLVGAASLLDDLHSGDATYSTGWLAIALLVAVGAIPFKPRHFVGLGLSVMAIYATVMTWGAAWIGAPEMHMQWGQLIQLASVTTVCSGLVVLIYTSRYEQYRALRQAAEANRRLQQLERMKDRFFANVSHELRTSLTLILGPVRDALREDDEMASAAMRRRFQLMERSALRLLRLIDQLLDLARLDAGHVRLDRRPHTLTAWLHYVVSSFSLAAERRGIEILFDAEAEPGPVVEFDADLFEKVMVNLISNAVKFTPPQGKIYVGVRERRGDDGAWVEICVRDTGEGVPEEVLPFLFDRFYQARNAAHRGVRGTGIGLALVRELVELHGGSVRAESQLGFGSTFVVCLPYDPEREGRGGPVEVSYSPADGTADEYARWDGHGSSGGESDGPDEDPADALAEDTPSILVVDDDPDVREYLRGLLAGRYRVDEAADGVEALERARAAPPALVISDVVMPHLDGYGLCRAVKADDALKHVPVVLLTARTQQESEVEGLEAGADDYVLKPFHAEVLLARVENLIEVRRLLRDSYSEEFVLRPSDVTVASADAVFLEQVRDAVEAHMRHSNFGVEWLADEVGISPRHLQRRLRALTRLSAKGLINTMRLQRAARLLEQCAGTVAEIAYEVGFQDPGYFSRLFKQALGHTPSAHPRKAKLPVDAEDVSGAAESG